MGLFFFPIQSAKGQNIVYFPGAELYFYEAGTTTPKTTYTTALKSIAHSNPVVADGEGRFAPIWVDGEFDAVLKDSRGVMIWEAEGVQDILFGSIDYQGDFNSSTNGGDYPTGGARGVLRKCVEQFTLNAASGSHVLNAGDFILCNKDNAGAIDADWDIIRGDTVASETLLGIVKLATSAVAVAGVSTTEAVHPAGLKAAIEALWYSFSVSVSATQSIASSTPTVMVFDSGATFENFKNTSFNFSTNQFTVPISGVWNLSVNACFDDPGDTAVYSAAITSATRGTLAASQQHASTPGPLKDVRVPVSRDVYLTSGEIIYIDLYHDSGVAKTRTQYPYENFFTGHFLHT